MTGRTDDSPEEPDEGDDTLGGLLRSRDGRNVSALIGLGGNTGPLAETFDWVVSEFTYRIGEPVAVSRYYRTAAVGALSGYFLNAAVEVETNLDPATLLSLLQEMEDFVGRERKARWASRPLDLDLLACGDEVLDTPELTLPHPGCLYRRFVLDPVLEIAPDRVHPGCGLAFAELRDRVAKRPLAVTVVGDDGAAEDFVRRFAGDGQFPVEFVPWARARAATNGATPLLLCPPGTIRSADAVDLGRIPGSRGVAVRAVIEAAVDAPEPL